VIASFLDKCNPTEGIQFRKAWKYLICQEAAIIEYEQVSEKKK